ncbi:MAG: RNA polymerase sigma factor [Patescibacteria group bacterium]|nr:RNA polymerase sigma factor [Patescibacteria group bacterium]MBU1778185.1 RNA polymerase sigma factor [Patescibacteria group bacterium]MBU1987268.1 RNA polymerase sigma factor [Patescibacteria group bacterium]
MNFKNQIQKIHNILVKKNQDKELFLKLKESKNDTESFIAVYDLYVDHIFRFIYFKLNSNKEEAEDLTSAVFLKSWNYIQQNGLTDVKTLRALIYKIARTSIVDYYRKNAQIYINNSIDDKNIKLEIPDYNQSIDKQVATSYDFGIVETKLLALKDEYKEVIILRFINELSIKEIAQITEKSQGNIRTLIHRALKALRELMEEDV